MNGAPFSVGRSTGSPFVAENGVYLVLKDHVTRVFRPDGKKYVNSTGNAALAQAGSGDALNGIITGLLSVTGNAWDAAQMGVWLHGHLADLGLKDYSQHTFPLESYPSLMNFFLKEHGR